MACPKCGAQLPVGSKFCNQCEEKLGNVCPSCGAEVVQGSMFCSNCGQKLQ
ncbi:MAG: zinc-ribbon domain-containing protein [Oscillospiraceae bacterium]|nr:zinc-ribbon domain-containing protein [Oscillospiraceae bacterium]